MSESKELEIVESHPLELSASTAAWAKEHIASAMADNTKLAYASDIRRFEQWLKGPISYPVPLDTILKYIEDHPDNGQRGNATATTCRMMSTISKAHRYKRAKPNPIHTDEVREHLTALRRNAVKAGIKPRRMQAATGDILESLLAQCDRGTLKGKRDSAMLLCGFASGGRRQSELVNMRVEDLEETPLGFRWNLGITKTNQSGADDFKPIKGRPARFLKEWLAAAGITEGLVFRPVDRHDHVKAISSPMVPRRVAEAVKALAKKADYDPAHFAGHSIRRGFVTEAGQQGIRSGDAMKLSGHKSIAIFTSYYQASEAMANPAGDLGG